MNIELGNFDENFFKSIEGHEEVLLKEGGKYHTILVDGQKAGIVGYIPIKTTNFVQVALAKDFRGEGLVAISEGLLAQKYGLKELTATIDTTNAASVRAHQKAGFKTLSDEEINNLRKRGFLKENQIRMTKTIENK